MSLQKKFLITLSAILIASFTVFYIVVHIFFVKFVEQRFSKVSYRNAVAVANQIETVLSSFEIHNNSLAINLNLTDKNQIKTLVDNLISENSEVVNVSVYDSKKVHYSTPAAKFYPPKLPTSQNNIIPDANIFSDIHINKQGRDTVITIFSPIIREGISKGGLAIDYSVTSMYNILKRNRSFGKTDESYLVDRENFMVSPSRFKNDVLKKQKIPPFPSQDLSTESQSISYTNYMGTQVINSSVPIPRLNCMLYHELSLEEAYQPVETNLNVIIWMFCAVFLLFIGTMFFVFKRIFRPLKSLQTGIHLLTKGDHEFDVEITGNDEISNIYHSFNSMRERVKETEIKLKEHSNELELQVDSRTLELDDKIGLLEKKTQETMDLAVQREKINLALQDEIAERKKVTSALIESEKRYKIVSDISSDYAYALEVKKDGSLVNLWMTGAYEQMTGYTMNEMEEKGGWEVLIHPDDAAIAIHQVGIYLSGMPSESEYRIINKSGEIRWVRDRGRPEWDVADQRVTYIYGAVKDITLQKKAQEKLKNSEVSYRELFDNMLDAIYILDSEGIFISVNKGAEKKFSFSRQEFIRKSIEIVLAPDLNDLKEIHKIIKTVFTGKPYLTEFWCKRKNGEIFPEEVHLHKGMYFGRPVVIIFGQDISRRKRTEVQLQRLSHSVEQSPVSIVITDASAKIEYVNQHFLKVTGFSKDEILGSLLSDLRAKDVPESIYTDLWTTVSSGHVWHGELLCKKKQGSDYWDEVMISHISDKAGKTTGYIAFKTDITEKKHMEEQFLQSQKMEGIGRLAGGVAHDFNNILTLIIGYSELILTEISEEDALYTKIKQIDKAGRRAEALTRQLLAFSRKQIMQSKVLDLNQLIGDMEKMLHRLIGEHIGLQTLLSEQMMFMKADPGQIEQVIMNLCINARDAMPDGGIILISTENVHIRHEETSLSGNMEEGNYIRLKISDSGIGMDENLTNKIFEPFFTTKDPGKGTGLGLSTVYGIIKQSKAHIFVNSEIGKGTEFDIYFPQVEEIEIHEEDSTIPASDLEGNETILLVEDEDDLRVFASETIEKYGYNILKAEDGQKAIDLAVHYNDPIHLLLTDVIMPNIGGRVLSEKIARIHPEAAVLFMSGYTDDEIVHQGELAQDIEFIQKPFTPTSLLQNIRKVLEK